MLFVLQLLEKGECVSVCVLFICSCEPAPGLKVCHTAPADYEYVISSSSATAQSTHKVVDASRRAGKQVAFRIPFLRTSGCTPTTTCIVHTKRSYRRQYLDGHVTKSGIPSFGSHSYDLSLSSCMQ